ncbi:DUF1643 domain-containing protein [Hoylesella marshii]|uniref:DUF1643 domain-containing protein n=1 Tax=Hoylesella marshii TaxID=189722 RepID=UPI0028D0D6C7|nr:DUF1643 domain-containing protein [Hoylesella marshii]
MKYEEGKMSMCPEEYNDQFRFWLKKEGKKPLIVIGANPSTATDEDPDPTVRKVMKYAELNGFDSFIMLNVYPQRTPYPKCLNEECDMTYHQENVKAIRQIVSTVTNPIILLAFGDVITKRPYLRACFRDIVESCLPFNPQWKRIGDLTQKRNPRHPGEHDTYKELKDFNVLAYLCD